MLDILLVLLGYILYYIVFFITFALYGIFILVSPVLVWICSWIPFILGPLWFMYLGISNPSGAKNLSKQIENDRINSERSHRIFMESMNS